MASGSKPEKGVGLGKQLVFAAISVVICLALIEISMQLAGMAMTRLRETELKPGAKVIVCLGDSHTYGVYVSREETYPAQLEKLLNQGGGKYQVINLGAPGQNSAQVLQALPLIVEKYRPVAIVLMVGANNGWNISGQEQNFQQKILMKLKLYKLLRIVYVQTAARDKKYLVSRRRDSGEFQHNIVRNYWPEETAEIKAIQRLFINDMVKIVTICRERGIKIVLMNYAGDKDNNFYPTNPHIAQVSQKIQVPMVDNYAFFISRLYRPDKSLDEMLHEQLFFKDMHLKPKGYSWVANNLFLLLKEQRIVD